jgi:hypothetical protein
MFLHFLNQNNWYSGPLVFLIIGVLGSWPHAAASPAVRDIDCGWNTVILVKWPLPIKTDLKV